VTGLYVKLDTNWPDHPKVIAAGLNGAGLHALALCLAKRLLTDGIVHRSQLLRYDGVTPELIDWVVECGLFEAVDEHRIAVHDWLDRNPSRLAIGGRIGARISDGKRGNHKRWRHEGRFEDCSRCWPDGSPLRSGGDRGANRIPIGGYRQSRDRDSSNSMIAATLAHAEQNTERIKAMHAEPPPALETTAQGIQAARQAKQGQGVTDASSIG